MLRRQRTGSVICTSCGVLVGVNDETCYNCGRRNPGLWGFAPALRSLGADLGFVPFVIGTCAFIYVLTLVFSGGNIGGGGLFSFLGPSQRAVIVFGASGWYPVFVLGRWWTVLSATWLHAGILHILFNMLSLRQLAPAVSDLYGPGRMVIIYTVAGVAGFALSTLAGVYIPPLPFLAGARETLGASASISGLVGAILYYGRRSGSSIARSYASNIGLSLIVYGLMLPGIDNYAHAGGFAGGYLTARMLDPLKPERIDHIVIAVLCLAISIGSVAWSVVSVMLLLARAQ